MKSIIAFCCLFTVGCTNHGELASLKSSLRISGETIVAKQDESLTILKENTTALAAIKAKVDTLKASQVDSEPGNGKECDLSSDPSQSTETVVNDSQAASPGTQPVSVSAVELFICSTASCAPCKRLWRDADDGKLDGFVLTEVPAFDGLKSYPAIRFADPDSDTRWSVIYGYDEATRLWLRSKLLDEGIVSHAQTTHGVSLTGGQPVTGSFFQVSRQSAVLNSKPAIRSFPQRKSFVGRARTSARQSCPAGGCP